MPSQSSWESQRLSGPETLSLAKLSYATVLGDSVAPIPWTHISSQGALFAVFDTSRVHHFDGRVEEQSEMKVVNGAQRLDILKLETLGLEAKRTQALGSNPNEYSTVVIVRVPCLAIRYPIAERQVRRIQMRFSKDADYYRAMQKLSEAGCPLTSAANSSPKPPLRPSSALPTSAFVDKSSLRDPRPATAIPTTNRASEPAYSNGPLLRQLSVISQNEGSFKEPIIEKKADRTYHLGSELPSFNLESNHEHNLWSHDVRTPEDMLSNHYYTTLPQMQHKNSWTPIPTSSHPLNKVSLTPPVGRSEIGDLMYTPRPSIAPKVQEQGSIAPMLPPPRELPFKKSTPRSGLPPSPPRTTDLQIGQTNGAEASSKTNSTKIEVMNQPGTPCAKPSKKRDTSKRVKRPTEKASLQPPRKKPATSRKKGAVVETHVPTVDEILQRDKAKDELAMPKTQQVDKNTEVQVAGDPAPIRESGPSEAAVSQDGIPGISVLRINLAGQAHSTSTSNSLAIIPDSQPLPSTSPSPEHSDIARPSTLSKDQHVPDNDRQDLQLSSTLLSKDLSNYTRDEGMKRDRLAALEKFLYEQLEDPGFHNLVLDMEMWWPRFHAEKSLEKDGGMRK